MTIKPGLFICITGIDGSGKSTQAKLLISNCQKQGFPLKYVYAKTVPILVKPVLLLAHHLILRNYTEDAQYLEYKSRKQSAIAKYSFFSGLFYGLLLFDYQIQLFFKITLPVRLKQNIVCDRYIFDTIITDIAVDRQYSLDEIINSIDRIYRKFPEPDLIYVIDIPEKIAFSRKTDIASIEYLKERRETYLAIADRYKIRFIDGTDSIETIQSKIFHDVKTLFSR